LDISGSIDDNSFMNPLNGHAVVADQAGEQSSVVG
jgi:hypothetical protein